ncbi:CPBP family intramembrane glutamic endopeptidase [Nitrospira sp. M1]
MADQGGNPSVGFSFAWTLVCTLVFLGGMGLLVWSYGSLTSLERVENPERALEHIVSRSMSLESSLKQVSPWEQSVYRVLNGEDETVKPLVRWYTELTHESDDPVNALYAGVLEAEAGHSERMKTRVEAWDVEDERWQLFRDMLETAYGGKAHNPENIHRLQARLAEEVPDNWFYRRLALHLATRAHDTAFVRMTQDHLQSRQSQLVWRNRLLIFVEVGGAFVSLMALLIVLWIRYRKGEDGLVVGHAALPPPWKGGDGFAVLMRGAAVTFLFLAGLGALLGAYFSFLNGGVNEKVIELISTVILYVPIPWLLYYYLLRPKGYSLRHVFGCQLRQGKVGVLSLTVLSLFACGLFGDVVVSFAGDVVGRSTHWTEWFQDSLVWGDGIDLFILFVEVVVLAPIFEEIIFRGIVYASLRRRFGWTLSAVLSAAIFAIVHGYGIVGLLAVGWSGFLWAWAYEKTGSLLPGIAAHALNNFVFMASLLVVFR